jgi:FMN reductase
MNIVAISAGLSDASSTTLLATQLADAVRAQHGDAHVDVIGLRDLAHEITDASITGFAARRLQHVYDQLTAADAIIAVSPIYKASYPGLFKSFFDGLDNDALTGKPVLLAATGGTARHSLAIDFAMRPLFAYLQTLQVPTSVFAAPEDWGDPRLAKRVDRAAAELVSLLKGAGTGRSRESEIDLFSETMASIRNFG